MSYSPWQIAHSVTQSDHWDWAGCHATKLLIRINDPITLHCRCCTHDISATQLLPTISKNHFLRKTLPAERRHSAWFYPELVGRAWWRCDYRIELSIETSGGSRILATESRAASDSQPSSFPLSNIAYILIQSSPNFFGGEWEVKRVSRQWRNCKLGPHGGLVVAPSVYDLRFSLLLNDQFSVVSNWGMLKQEIPHCLTN